MNHFYASMVIYLLLSSCGILMFASNLRWWWKVYTLCALILAGMVSYRVMNMAYGFPQHLQKSHDNALVVGQYVDKPKAIYLWIKEPGKEGPVSYKMPYTLKMDSLLSKMRMKHRGKPFRLKIETKTYPLERFGDDIDVDAIAIPMLPPKTMAP